MLGPILFLLYINDLTEDIQSQVRLFADDTAVYLTLDKQNCPQQLQDDLNQLKRWETMSDMEFNQSECVVMHITRVKRPTNSQYTMHNQIVNTVDTARYLGVAISSNLKFKIHNRITSNANKTLGLFQRNIRVKRSSLSDSVKASSGICLNRLQPIYETKYKQGWDGPAQGEMTIPNTAVSQKCSTNSAGDHSSRGGPMRDW